MAATLDDVLQRLEALGDEVRELRAVVAKTQPLVDLKTAAEHMGVSTRTLRRMVAAETIPYRRVGTSLRFNLSLLSPERRHLV